MTRKVQNRHFNLLKWFLNGGIAALLVGVNAAAWSSKTGSQGDFFSSHVKGLREEGKTEIVELRNGDTFDHHAFMVRKEIGGKPLKMLAYNGSIPGPTIKVA